MHKRSKHSGDISFRPIIDIELSRLIFRVIKHDFVRPVWWHVIIRHKLHHTTYNKFFSQESLLSRPPYVTQPNILVTRTLKKVLRLAGLIPSILPKHKG